MKGGEAIMQITPRGVVVLMGCILVTIPFFMFVEVWVVLALYLVKYIFGDGAVLSLYRLTAGHYHLLQRAYLSWVGGLLELVLGTRIAYTIVDGSGTAQHASRSTSAADDAKGREGFYVELDAVLRPPSKPGHAKIIIMNHHCRVDWLYMFIFFARTRSIIQNVRFVLKASLRQIPVLGWAMESFRYLFLSRSWEGDEAYVRHMIEFFQATMDTPVIFIFPEGTDLSESNVARSHAYATKAQLPQFHHVLNPRTTGTVAIMQMLGGAEKVEEVIDLTIGYTYHAPGERPDESSIVNGHHPRKVHLLIQRYPVVAAATAQDRAKVCPSEPSALASWIHDRFAEKEQLLSRFYASNPIGFDAADLRAVLGQEVGLAGYDDDDDVAAQLQGLSTQQWWRRYYRHVGFFGAIGCPLYWMMPILYWVFFTQWWRSTVWTVVLLIFFFFGLRAVGGLQRSLFLKKVPPQHTAMQQLRRWLARQQAKEDGTKED